MLDIGILCEDGTLCKVDVKNKHGAKVVAIAIMSDCKHLTSETHIISDDVSQMLVTDDYDSYGKTMERMEREQNEK